MQEYTNDVFSVHLIFNVFVLTQAKKGQIFRATNSSIAGNTYLKKILNVTPKPL